MKNSTFDIIVAGGMLALLVVAAVFDMDRLFAFSAIGAVWFTLRARYQLIREDLAEIKERLPE
jgi:hypothetical protein